MRGSALIFVILGSVFMTVKPSPVSGQSVAEERAELIKTQNALRIFREFDQDSRHLYFLQANAIIAVQGGWNEGELAYGTLADLLGEAAESLLLPKFKRLSSRLESNKNLSDLEKARLLEAVEQSLEAVDLSMTMANALNARDLETALALYHEQSVPLFEAVWATTYTLISEAERQFPRR